MPNHHPQPTPTRPTGKQQRYLRTLAERTGTSFTPPKTKADASREIERLQGRSTDRRSDQTRERRQVLADLQAGVADAVRHQTAETTGYGADCQWSHSTRVPKSA